MLNEIKEKLSKNELPIQSNEHNQNGKEINGLTFYNTESNTVKDSTIQSELLNKSTQIKLNKNNLKKKHTKVLNELKTKLKYKLPSNEHNQNGEEINGLTFYNTVKDSTIQSENFILFNNKKFHKTNNIVENNGIFRIYKSNNGTIIYKEDNEDNIYDKNGIKIGKKIEFGKNYIKHFTKNSK